MCFFSTASKKKKSLTISAPIPCNTAFPPDHPALSKLSVPEGLAHKDTDTRSARTPPEVSDSEDSGSAGSVPGTPGRQSVCSEGEAAKHHHTNGDAAEQPGSQHVSTSSLSEDTPTSEEKHEPEPEPEPEPDIAESVTTTEPEQETEHREEEDGGGKREQSKELKKGPEVTSQPADGSRPPGFLYRVRALASNCYHHVPLKLQQMCDVTRL